MNQDVIHIKEVDQVQFLLSSHFQFPTSKIIPLIRILHGIRSNRAGDSPSRPLPSWATQNFRLLFRPFLFQTLFRISTKNIHLRIGCGQFSDNIHCNWRDESKSAKVSIEYSLRQSDDHCRQMFRTHSRRILMILVSPILLFL